MAEPLRLGIIGAGRVFERLYLPALQAASSPFALVAIADPRHTNASPALVGGARLHESAAAMLASERLDAVAVLTPPALHAEHVEEALRAGLPVLVEKPVTTSADEIETWLEYRAATLVTPALPRRYWQRYRDLRNGNVGLTLRLRLETDPSSWSSLGSPHQTDPAHDLFPHLLDLARWIIGAELTAVAASAPPGEASAELTFTDGTSAQIVAAHGELYLEQAWLGDRAIPIGPPGRLASLARRLRGLPDNDSQGVDRLLRAWAATLRGRKARNLPALADGWATVAMLEAWDRSADSGGTPEQVAPFPG